MIRQAEGEEDGYGEGDRNREIGLRHGDVELTGEGASLEVVDPVQLGVVGGEERGHRAGFVGCRGGHAGDAVVEDVPGEAHVLGDAVDGVDEDGADDRARAVDRFVGSDDAGHAQAAFEEMDAVEDGLRLLAVDGDPGAIFQKIGRAASGPRAAWPRGSAGGLGCRCP